MANQLLTVALKRYTGEPEGIKLALGQTCIVGNAPEFPRSEYWQVMLHADGEYGSDAQITYADFCLIQSWYIRMKGFVDHVTFGAQVHATIMNNPENYPAEIVDGIRRIHAAVA